MQSFYLSLTDRFLFAKIQLDYLMHKHDREDIIAAIYAQPETLSDTYGKLIYNQAPEKTDLAKRVLSWISASKRPLTSEELQHAISTTPDSVGLDEHTFIEGGRLVSVCRGLVVQNEESGILRLVHHSLKSYLERSAYSNLTRDLARTCLKYLDRIVSSGEVWQDQQSFNEHMAKQKFARYVAQFWGSHCRGGPEEDQEIRNMIFKLLSNGKERKRVLQIERYVSDIQGSNSDFPVNMEDTVLHILARHGLPLLCKLVLEPDTRYVLGFVGD
jgi:hypothetical protein